MKTTEPQIPLRDQIIEQKLSLEDDKAETLINKLFDKSKKYILDTFKKNQTELNCHEEVDYYVADTFTIDNIDRYERILRAYIELIDFKINVLVRIQIRPADDNTMDLQLSKTSLESIPLLTVQQKLHNYLYQEMNLLNDTIPVEIPIILNTLATNIYHRLKTANIMRNEILKIPKESLFSLKQYDKDFYIHIDDYMKNFKLYDKNLISYNCLINESCIKITREIATFYPPRNINDYPYYELIAPGELLKAVVLLLEAYHFDNYPIKALENKN